MNYVGLAVFAVRPGSAADGWNQRCRLTFPDDQLHVGDIILRANGIGPNLSSPFPEDVMTDELINAPHFILVVLGFNW